MERSAIEKDRCAGIILQMKNFKIDMQHRMTGRRFILGLKKKESTLFQFRVVDYLEIHMPFSQTAFDDLFIWNLLKNPT